jgi:hypothetical protein
MFYYYYRYYELYCQICLDYVCNTLYVLTGKIKDCYEDSFLDRLNKINLMKISGLKWLINHFQRSCGCGTDEIMYCGLCRTECLNDSDVIRTYYVDEKSMDFANYYFKSCLSFRSLSYPNSMIDLDLVHEVCSLPVRTTPGLKRKKFVLPENRSICKFKIPVSLYQKNGLLQALNVLFNYRLCGNLFPGYIAFGDGPEWNEVFTLGLDSGFWPAEKLDSWGRSYIDCMHGPSCAVSYFEKIFQSCVCGWYFNDKKS